VSSDSAAPSAVRVLTACLLVLAAPLAAAGQVVETGIRGQVIDGAGEPVSGALITAVREGVPSRTAVTGTAGRFRITGLEPGSYRLRAEALGYRTGGAGCRGGRR
jgi:protocatechuate 3,4-dioxygenase beta subunit